jgi:hypothetical protein
MENWSQDILQSLQNYRASGNPELYNSDFFRSHIKYRPIYDFIGDMIYVSFRVNSVIDWGCGCGFLLDRLFKHGVTKVLGIEGSTEVVEFWKSELPSELQSKLVVADVTQPLDIDGPYDMAVCMEVAEHLSEEYAEDFVKRVANSATKLIWWTAAQPGQGGTGHINCQPVHYWEELFEHNSEFRVDWEKTYEMKSIMLQNHSICLAFPWFRDNCMILLRR